MDRYEIEYQIRGLAVCKPETYLTNEMMISETNTKDHSFSVIISTNSETPDDAVDETFRKLDLYLDFYNLFFDIALEIKNGGKPFSVAKIKDDKVIAESFSLSLEIGPLFFLTDEIKNTAIDVLTVLSEPRNNYLQIAADYNRRASLEKNGTDKLIHLFIALEALFAHEEEKTEIQYKFANRISTLLGKDTEHRKSIKDRAKKLYNLRSKIVHGSSKYGAENIEDVFDWVQESILRFLILSDKHSKLKHKDLIEMIDDAMLESIQRKNLRKESEDLVKILKKQKLKQNKNLKNNVDESKK